MQNCDRLGGVETSLPAIFNEAKLLFMAKPFHEFIHFMPSGIS
jgi:hypothetical protein